MNCKLGFCFMHYSHDLFQNSQSVPPEECLVAQRRTQKTASHSKLPVWAVLLFQYVYVKAPHLSLLALAIIVLQGPRVW